jgi:hypothetical protein
VFVGDLDVDGDYDVVSSGSQASLVKWYENDGLQNFTAHTIASLAGARAVHVANINNDSLPDIAAVGLQDYVVWYENMGGGSFTTHNIDFNLDLAFGLYVADLDTDGDQDILATGGLADDLVWYESDLIGITENDSQNALLSGIQAIYNQPNPLSTQTTFYFETLRPMSITLGIYDVSGRVVQKLTHHVEEAGYVQISWDRCDSSGSMVPAGIYFYVAESGGTYRTGQVCVVD